MDGPRFPTAARSLSIPINRRNVLRGMAGGFAAALAGSRLAPSSAVAAGPAAQAISPVGLGNPAARILLPGDAGLTDFGLDFQLAGPPAVFFAAGDTPGWSSDLKAGVSGFAFGYAATLARPHHSIRTAGRAVQVCLHHGFPSADDANVAWFSLTTALASGGDAVNKDATINALDVVEVFSVSGRHAVLASVDADQFDAVVLTSRSKSDLVTVAIADFTGRTPTIDEAIALAEVEAAKLERLVDAGRWDLASAFHAQWTPGFTFGGGGVPFFAWPEIRDGEPIPRADDTDETFALRRQLAAGVRFQSQVDGRFAGSAPAMPDHDLYYSGQTNFFAASGDAKHYHEETSARLRAGLPGLSLRKPLASRNQRLYPYELPSELGKLGGLMLHRIVADGDFPLSLALHVVSVPRGGSSFDLSDLIDRLEPLLQAMGDGVENCLLAPHSAPAVIAVSPPA